MRKLVFAMIYSVTVLKGVDIGSGAIIGAKSVVTKKVAPLSIVAGIPAKSLNNRV